jgi:hypothetical protein
MSSQYPTPFRKDFIPLLMMPLLNLTIFSLIDIFLLVKNREQEI